MESDDLTATNDVDSRAVDASQGGWWLSIYRRLSSRARRLLTVAFLATALLARPVIGVHGAGAQGAGLRAPVPAGPAVPVESGGVGTATAGGVGTDPAQAGTAPGKANAPAADPYANPAVQNALHQLGLHAPASPNTPNSLDNTPTGGQFQVNEYTTMGQSFPSVALDGDGDFVVVWQSTGSGYGDDSGTSIQAQRYNSVGAAQGSQFQVNSYTTADQVGHSVAMDADGDFVVIWQSDGSGYSDTDAFSIQGQRYNSVGAPQGTQFEVNAYTTGAQRNPAVAMDSGGNFVAVWDSIGSDGSDNDILSIQAQRFDPSGAPQGSQFQVNTYITDQQRYPDVAMDADGDFVAVWESLGSSGTDNDSISIQAQRFNSVGVAQGGEFQVNTYFTSSQFGSSVALDADGDFVVAWDSFGSDGGDTDSFSIQARRYDSVGAPQGGQFQVNTYTTAAQRYSSVAIDAMGAFVVTWVSLGSNALDYSDYSIQGRRYDSVGAAQGRQFEVNTYTTNAQDSPAVALDADGDFVVAWTSSGSSETDTDSTSIQAQRFRSTVVPAPNGQSQFQVNAYTTHDQRNPSVASSADGDFVVVWQSYGSGGSDTNLSSIHGQRYNAAGTAQGSQFQVNDYATNAQRNPSVAMDADGDFVVVWDSNGSYGTDGAGYSIQGQRYDSAGGAVGGEFQVNFYTTDNQRYPSVALDADGDFVVVWGSYGSNNGDTDRYSIHGQRFDSAGAPAGGEFQVNAFTTDNQLIPSVAMDADGDFVVVWDSDGSYGPDADGASVQGRRYDSAGLAKDSSEFQVNTYATSDQFYASVALDEDGDFVVVWQSLGSSGGDNLGYSIQAQRYDSTGLVQGSEFQVNAYTTDHQRYASVAMDSDGDFAVTWQSSGSGGSDISPDSIQGRTFRRDGQALQGEFQANTITAGSQQRPAVAIDANGDFVVAWYGYSDAGNDYDNSIQAARFDFGQSDYQVNSYTTGNQTNAAVAMDANGSFVVVWDSDGSSGTDLLGYSIQGRLFYPAGNPQGSQFQVNAFTTGNQRRPSVAMDADGDFVVAWDSEGSYGPDATGYSIQSRRYDSSGAPKDSNEFQVNTYSTGEQRQPSVALDSDGDFVVAWQSEGAYGPDAVDYSIQARRYDSSGAPKDSNEFQVNTYSTNPQRYSSVALDADGDFAVVWQSDGSDGTDADALSVQGQRFLATGGPVGPEFQVNTYTTGDQGRPSVAMDATGDLAVVWQSNGSYGTDADVFSVQGRRYDAAGASLGPEFQVNTFTPSNQLVPRVAMDARGDLVVVWQGNGSDGGDTDSYSIHGQRYNAMGTAQGGEFQVNTYTTSQQSGPSVALDADGDFLVVWQSIGVADPPSPAYLLEAMAPGSPTGLDADPDFGIAAGRFQAQGGPLPTAVTLQAFGAEAVGGGWSAFVAGVGAVVSAWWWRVRGKRSAG